jgi:hypothetical protein
MEMHIVESSVLDPDLNLDPDQLVSHVLGPPRSGSRSISQRYESRYRSDSGSGSGSFYKTSIINLK